MNTIWGLDHKLFGCNYLNGNDTLIPCSACCIGMAVPETGKDVLEPRDKLVGSMCGTYDQRPQSCRNFHCGVLPTHQQLFLLEIEALYGSAPRKLVESRKNDILSELL